MYSFRFIFMRPICFPTTLVSQCPSRIVAFLGEGGLYAFLLDTLTHPCTQMLILGTQIFEEYIIHFRFDRHSEYSERTTLTKRYRRTMAVLYVNPR